MKKSQNVVLKCSIIFCPKSKPSHQFYHFVAGAKIRKILRSARGLDVGEVKILRSARGLDVGKIKIHAPSGNPRSILTHAPTIRYLSVLL